MNFIHGSDFHLGYVQYGLHERFVDFATTFKAFITYGLEHNVDFILIAGDLFEKRNINAPTYLQAYNVLSQLQDECKSLGRAPIPVIAIEGNHDLAYQRDRNSWLQILESQGMLRLLKSTWDGGLKLDYVDVGNCRVFGVGYLGASTMQSIPLIDREIQKINQGMDQSISPCTSQARPHANSEVDSAHGVCRRLDRFTVLTMHFGMEEQARSVVAGEIPYSALLPLRECVDYLALGHYHNQYEYDHWVYNGGSLELFSLNEYGLKKGFYHVTDSGADLVTIPTRQFKRLSGNISSVKTPSEISLLVQSIVESETPVDSKLSPIVELTLWGNLNFPKKDVPLPELREMVKKRFGCLYADVHIKQTNDCYTLHESDIVGMSREQIETKILREQILQDGRYKLCVKQVVSDTVEAKKLALQRINEKEIIRLLKQSFDQIQLHKKQAREENNAGMLPFMRGDVT
ncbi:MAG: Calcineurin-like phosphoesterase [Candidatus Argoarchaeum ethanivorans]|uniref:Calcineurin-like phosphoesterase n=1 Tax=Candidatus Argoarchaeum ethanivorans TaxID=2608793 RepID=A0A811T6G6_9EURY|nr:MAG: Calcineurin-like phosphoesterase [Candidatus Argoarchaeum ethanivorans]